MSLVFKNFFSKCVVINMYIKHSQTSLSQLLYEHTLNNSRKQKKKKTKEIEKSVHQDCACASLAACIYINIELSFFAVSRYSET